MAWVSWLQGCWHASRHNRYHLPIVPGLASENKPVTGPTRTGLASQVFLRPVVPIVRPVKRTARQPSAWPKNLPPGKALLSYPDECQDGIVILLREPSHELLSRIRHQRLVLRLSHVRHVLAALTLVIWRFLLNLNAGTNLNEFLPAFQDGWRRRACQARCTFCKEQKGLIPRKLFVAGLETSKQGLAAMRRAMANVIELEILPDLNFLLPPILAIAKIATMVGLLGTVISMINTFTPIRRRRQHRRRGPASRRHRPGPVRHRPGPGDGHPAGLRPRPLQGLDRQVRGEDEERRPEAAAAGAGAKPGRRPRSRRRRPRQHSRRRRLRR